jgi:acetyltransferase-like isoleucine patch superfamily enzyme
MKLALHKFYKRLRQALLSARVRGQAKKCGQRLKVNGWSSVSRKTELGDNVNFNGLVVSGNGPVRIGDNFHSGAECLLISFNHNYDAGAAIPYDAIEVEKAIVIEANVWLGSRVIVLGGVTIGEGAIIQAGSCVVHDIPRCAIAGGHPARVFSQRDVEHYERLKAQGKFH